MADISKINIGETIYDLKDSEARIQVSTMPVASADLLGKILQFVGATGGGYTNGYFYKCEEDATPGTYKWTAVSVQSGGGGGSSTIDIRSTDPVNPSAGQMWVLVSSS